MNGRFLRGVAPDQDASNDAAMLGGSLNVRGTASGKTERMLVTDCTPFQDEAKNTFGGHAAVWDTPAPESACQHTHEVKGLSITAEVEPPPYRGVIFLVRVR